MKVFGCGKWAITEKQIAWSNVTGDEMASASPVSCLRRRANNDLIWTQRLGYETGPIPNFPQSSSDAMPPAELLACDLAKRFFDVAPRIGGDESPFLEDLKYVASVIPAARLRTNILTHRRLRMGGVEFIYSNGAHLATPRHRRSAWNRKLIAVLASWACWAV